MTQSFVAEYKADIIAQYRAQKEMADAALARVDDRMFFTRLRSDGDPVPRPPQGGRDGQPALPVAQGDEHTNSIAILVKHLGGNLRSRWMDFLTTDGEKPDRHREREFMEKESDNRAEIMQRWERGWQTLFDTLQSLHDEDFSRTITIRGEPHTVIQAIHRNLLHAAHHIGQMDLLATVLR